MNREKNWNLLTKGLPEPERSGRSHRYALLLLFWILLLFPRILSAVSAYPGAVSILQPDGTRITFYLMGDEKVKWARTTDGYSILRNARGIFEYAKMDSAMDLVPSGIQARNPDERSAPEHLFLNGIAKGLTYSKSQINLRKRVSLDIPRRTYKSASVTGNWKFLCILIGFTDKAFTKTKADFENLLNQTGYSADNATGSVYDFYRENSYGQVSTSFTVAGPYTALHDMAYYGANDANGEDIRPEALVAEAVNQADAEVNFADFDNDKDGKVDGIYVIHAGYGEDSGASANTIWAHSSTIPTLTLDGVKISNYACSSELRGTTGTGITRIGVICHELGHIFGTADFYDTNYTTNGSYDGTGKWDLMGNGSWNNSGATPAHHNPYTKVFVYGWATAKKFTSGATVTLKDAETDNGSFYTFQTPTSNEYFILENRQQKKFDASLPGHGLIIYHVDGNFIATAKDEINVGSHQGMYPVCASATGLPPSTYGTINSTGLPFPGSENKSSFTDLTIPNSLSWAGAKSNAPITNITEDNTAKTISFLAPVIPDPPANVLADPASLITQSTFQANWEAVAGASGYRLDLSTSETFASFISGYNDKDVGTAKSLSITGLLPRTTYFYRLRAINLGGVSGQSNVVRLTTFSTPPAAPGNVSSISCNDQVTIRWKKPGDPYVKKYRIYGGTTSNPVKQIDSVAVGGADTLRVLSGLEHGRTYYFRVTAVNDDGPESAFSTQASTVIKTGIIPLIAVKWGDVLICPNPGDSIKGYQWYKDKIAIPQATGQFYATGRSAGSFYVVVRDYDGCQNPSAAVSGLNLKSLTLYPNPAVSSTTLRLSDPLVGTARVTLYNASGRLVKEVVVTNTVSQWEAILPLDGLEEGIYVVNLVQNQTILSTTKLIVKRK
ncbi:MAG: M6 family metalloprotease domain-containing protein [Marinilabiliales bacterium]|nr:M6 family metalloprotease domain-containing protein [Marinilabiliales bacterium]